MATIHPTSCVDLRAELAADVVVGPGCVIEGPARIGEGTRLVGHVWLRGRVAIGAGNVLYPNVCVGFEPQDRKFDPEKETGGVTIGERNILREGVTIHRATGTRPTTLGDENMLMCNAHLGHDAVVGNRCILANGVLLAGHTLLEDNVTFGGNAGIHQFCRAGRLGMVSGIITIVQDLPPFCVAYSMRSVGSLNIVGLRRAGLREHIPALKRAFQILFMERHTRGRAVELIEGELGNDALCMEMARFVRGSKRGISPYRSGGEEE